MTAKPGNAEIDYLQHLPDDGTDPILAAIVDKIPGYGKITKVSVLVCARMLDLVNLIERKSGLIQYDEMCDYMPRREGTIKVLGFDNPVDDDADDDVVVDDAIQVNVELPGSMAINGYKEFRAIINLKTREVIVADSDIETITELFRNMAHMGVCLEEDSVHFSSHVPVKKKKKRKKRVVAPKLAAPRPVEPKPVAAPRPVEPKAEFEGEKVESSYLDWVKQLVMIVKRGVVKELRCGSKRFTIEKDFEKDGMIGVSFLSTGDDEDSFAFVFQRSTGLIELDCISMQDFEKFIKNYGVV